jgi:hypothetical protein
VVQELLQAVLLGQLGKLDILVALDLLEMEDLLGTQGRHLLGYVIHFVVVLLVTQGPQAMLVTAAREDQEAVEVAAARVEAAAVEVALLGQVHLEERQLDPMAPFVLRSRGRGAVALVTLTQEFQQ